MAYTRKRFGRGRREFILATFRETSCGRCKSTPGKAFSAGLHALEGRSRDLSKPLYYPSEKTCVTSSSSHLYFSRVKAMMGLHMEYIKKKLSCVFGLKGKSCCQPIILVEFQSSCLLQQKHSLRGADLCNLEGALHSSPLEPNMRNRILLSGI